MTSRGMIKVTAKIPRKILNSLGRGRGLDFLFMWREGCQDAYKRENAGLNVSKNLNKSWSWRGEKRGGSLWSWENLIAHVMKGHGYIYTETTHRKIIPGLLASNYFPPPKNMHSKSKSPPVNQRLVLFITSSPPAPSIKIWECIVISFLSVHAACLHIQRNCMGKNVEIIIS